uniref:RDD domain-containing protein n=1 Tax=Hucho hucho TaxID=62062 RepID=A0A4W5MLF3_9TELE
MWQYYWGYVKWQSWMTLTTFHFSSCNFPGAANYQAPTGTPWPAGQPTLDARYGSNYLGIGYPFPAPPTTGAQTGQQMIAGTPPHDTRPVQQQNGNATQTGTLITTNLRQITFLAETVDFFILFCVKATIILWIMHLSGMKEIDEKTSMEDLRKMMAVALVYRVLVCFYEVHSSGLQGACLVLVCFYEVQYNIQPFLSPPSSMVRALNNTFSIAFLFPVFTVLFFFQHNRTVYDIVAGTIVVQRRGVR